MAQLRFLAILIFLLVSTAESLRILGLFPHPGLSHFHIFHPVMRGLAAAGHDVFVVSHFPDKNPPKYYKDIPLPQVQTLSDSIDLAMFENRKSYFFMRYIAEFFLINNWGKSACEATIKSQAIDTVFKLGKEKPFDVILVEQFNTDCMLGIAYLLKTPVIGLSSCALMPWHYDRVANPHIPSYIPTVFAGLSEKMGFGGRLANWIVIHGMKLLYRQYSEKPTTELLRKRFGNDMPDIRDLVQQTSLILVNQHYSLSGAKPLSPAVIEIGGIHIQKPKTLELSLQHILNTSEHGVIYISWGSMIRAETLPEGKRDAILKAMSRFKHTVLWKWENDTLPNQPRNVHIRKWMPQRDILCHPKVKVFLTHGGLLGTSEAAYCGVPIIITPMYGDQFLNAAAAADRGMGVILNYEDISENKLVKAIKTALDPKTVESAKNVSIVFKNRQQNPLDTAIWWVEHVAKTGGSPLTKSIASSLPGYVYYSLDVYALFICLICVINGSWFWVFWKIHKKERLLQKLKHN